MQFESLPQATRDLFHYAAGCPELAPFTLVGGTALALQTGHRLSLDLDFATFDETLPRPAIQQWVNRLRDEGVPTANITSPSAASTFRINTGKSLEAYAQDYEIAGVKVTFFAHARTAAQRQWYQQADRLLSTERSFSILGLDGLKTAKTLVLADRIRSRDLYDLMILIRDHGLTLSKMAELVRTLGHNNDFERYSAAMTGELPLDQEDEGLTGPKVTETMQDVYEFLGSHVDQWQLRQALAAK